MSKLALVIALLGANAFAVKTADCPDTLQVSVSDLNVTKSLEKLLKDYENDADEQIAAVKRAYAKVVDLGNVRRKFPLDEAKNGKCVYRNEGIEKIEVYSSGGKDKLYLQTKVGPRGILLRTYATVTEVSVDGISVDEDSGGLSLAVPRYPYESYTAGGALHFVGDATVKAK